MGSRLKFIRRIRGNLHGSIDVTALEDRVIDSRYFQRLRRVRQTAFLSYVFPGATHSRFEHSLGVMHLAGVAWEKLQHNQERLEFSTAKYDRFAERERSYSDQECHGLLAPTFEYGRKIFSSSYCLQALRLAGLLHDLGHPPFSHSGERFLPSARELINENPTLPDYLVEYLEGLSKAARKRGGKVDSESVSHEVCTVLLIDKALREIYQNHPELELQIDPRDVVSIVSPDVSPAPGSEIEKLKANQVLHELVSGEIDVDRMDYLQRDSKECGVVYGIFDSGRILDSLCIYFDPHDDRVHLAIQYSGLAAFEDYLRARQSMYLQLYFHKTSVAAEAMMQNIARQLMGWRLPADIDTYAEMDEHNIYDHLKDSIESTISDQAVREDICTELSGILKHRHLWKRVFELTGASNAIRHGSAIETAKEILNDSGCVYEQVSSANSLTTFRPRAKFEASQNYLRLIKKDARQFPRVFPTEDFLSLISDENLVNITRLYVRQNSRDCDANTIRKRIAEALSDGND